MVDVQVQVRRAERGDAAQIADLHVRTALCAFAEIFPPAAPRPDTTALTRDWERRLGARRPSTQAGFVAEKAGTVVGVAVGGPDPDYPDLGHLSRLYVDPNSWSRGIGRLLYDHCMAHLRRQGYRAATLWVLEGNDRARSWYERLGWRATPARKPTYAPAGIEDVRYYLLLTS